MDRGAGIKRDSLNDLFNVSYFMVFGGAGKPCLAWYPMFSTGTYSIFRVLMMPAICGKYRADAIVPAANGPSSVAVTLPALRTISIGG
jgi:hypothetical protein